MALKAGPKPRHVPPLPPPAPPVEWFQKATGISLYPWQSRVLEDLSGPTRPRVAYIQVSRKSGKTLTAAALAITEVCLKPHRHVYAISDSERNLNSVLMREIRDLVGQSDALRDSIHVYRDHLEVPETGSFIQTRPNNFKASQGINPHLTIFDEVHLQRSDDIWSGMQMAGAARPDALLFGITSPGYDLTSHAHSLYQAVKAGDPTVYGVIYEPDNPECDIDDRDAWRQANPCYDRPGFLEALEFDRSRLPEHEFRRFRLGLWTATSEAWLPYGVWDSLARPDVALQDGDTVHLGFDGSFSGDATALVACTPTGYLHVLGCWENPGRKGWRVPRSEVHAAVHDAFARFDVQTMYADPPFWTAEIQSWAAAYGADRVLEFPTYSRKRMAPACTAFYTAVMEGRLTHDGDPRLARHLANCVVKASPAGSFITKQDHDSPAKIDLAVASVIAYQAATRVREPTPTLALW